MKFILKVDDPDIASIDKLAMVLRHIGYQLTDSVIPIPCTIPIVWEGQHIGSFGLSNQEGDT